MDIKKAFYADLNERQRRQFAALEAKTLGRGGLETVCTAFEIDANTIRAGLRELKGEAAPLPKGRIRRVGGGRKKKS